MRHGAPDQQNNSTRTRRRLCVPAGRIAQRTEGDVAVGADAAEEELNTAVGSDLGLVAVALSLEIIRHAVQNVHVLGLDVDLHLRNSDCVMIKRDNKCLARAERRIAANSSERACGQNAHSHA